jgi:hypothetical protein
MKATFPIKWPSCHYNFLKFWCNFCQFSTIVLEECTNTLKPQPRIKGQIKSPLTNVREKNCKLVLIIGELKIKRFILAIFRKPTSRFSTFTFHQQLEFLNLYSYM